MVRRRARGVTRAYVPRHAVYVGGIGYGMPLSPFDNPFWRGSRPEDRQQALEDFRQYLRTEPDLVEQIRRELYGRDLACYCALTEPLCHANLLLEVAAGGAP